MIFRILKNETFSSGNWETSHLATKVILFFDACDKSFYMATEANLCGAIIPKVLDPDGG